MVQRESGGPSSDLAISTTSYSDGVFVLTYFGRLLVLLLVGSATCFQASPSHAGGGFPPDQPYASFWFPNDLLSWDPNADPDAPFNRSGVELQTRFRNPALQVNVNARQNEAQVVAISIMNPSTSNNPSQGSDTFDRFTFNYWQYLDILVFWGGSAGEGLILGPNPGVVDAGHRNGVKVLGTVFFPPNVFGGQIQWVEDLVQTSGPNFPVADKLIEVAEYYGFDGWFINQETNGGDAALATAIRDFIRYVHANSDLHIQWYDSMIESGSIAWQNQLNSLNDAFIEEDGPVADSMFLNFNWNVSRLNNSRALAQKLGHSPYELFAGIDTQANGYNTSANWGALFPDASPHVVSLGFYAPNWTYSNSTNQADFYQRANRFWVGANRDPANTSTADAWKGVANYIPAFSPIDSLPFVTHFNTGQGHLYAVDGEVLMNTDWNNRGLQDVLPTWRWRMESNGTPLLPELTWDDAYYGGTSLKISGDLTQPNQLDLFATQLDLSASSVLELTYKSAGAGTDTHLEVGMAFEAAGGTVSAFEYVDVGVTPNAGWNTAVFDLGGQAGRTLAVLSLRFMSDKTVNGYSILIGGMAVREGTVDIAQPASNLVIVNKDELDPQTDLKQLQMLSI